MPQFLWESFCYRDNVKPFHHFSIYGGPLLNPVNRQALPIACWSIQGPAKSSKNNITCSGVIPAVVCKRCLKLHNESTLVHINS